MSHKSAQFSFWIMNNADMYIAMMEIIRYQNYAVVGRRDTFYKLFLDDLFLLNY